jgi:hypothetical protein
MFSQLKGMIIAVFGMNMAAFPESDDEDESCNSYVDTAYSDSEYAIDDSSNNGDNMSASVIDKRYT